MLKMVDHLVQLRVPMMDLVKEHLMELGMEHLMVDLYYQLVSYLVHL